MKRTIGLLLTVVFALAVWMPMDASAQRNERSRGWQGQNREEWRDRGDRRWRSRRYRNTYGYRNYGQYRRTQVGNRRFRFQRQYYYWNGRRLSRMVRIYY